MSCWVVPTLAAEVWGVPLEQVLGQVRAGTVPSKVDCGFVLVDIAPDGQRIAPPPTTTMTTLTPARPRRSPPRRRRRTYVPLDMLDQAEAVALGVELKPDPPAPCGGGPTLATLATSATLAGNSPAALSPIDLSEPSADELMALRLGEPAAAVATAALALAEPEVVAPAALPAHAVAEAVSAAADDESEDGPDPNHGEADDGRPLDWRAARSRAARTRRPPPKRFD